MDGSGLGLTPSKRKPRKPKKQTKLSRIQNILEQIGLKQSVIKKVTIPKVIFDDYSDEDLLKYLLESEIQQDDNFTDYLSRIGFTKSKQRYYDAMLSKFEWYTYDQLVDIIVEYVIRKYEPIGLPGAKYLYNDLPVDQWIVHDGIVSCNVADVSKIKDIILQKTLHKKHIYFHTTSWGDAKDIVQNQVIHDKGRLCLDFGMTRSFYVTPDILTALDYTSSVNTLCSKEAAILVFSIDYTKYNSKTFTTVTPEWVDLTTSSRLCKTNILDDYDFVYGPMVANPKKIKKKIEKSKPHRPVKYQLASKTRTSDIALTNGLIGILWLSKEQ